MKEMYNVSASPHVRSGVTTAGIMRDVAIALAPACLFGIYWFGVSAVLVLLASVASAVVSEYLWNLLMKKPKTPYECSAIVTGLLIGMNMPSTIPLWIPVVASAFGIIVVKEMFGGLGQNFMNPALGARCFVMLCFTGRMTSFAIEKAQGSYLWNGAASIDGVSSATPLAVLKNLEEGASAVNAVSLKDMFFGFTGGVIGETSTLAILIGAAYLLVRKVISLRIPVAYIATFAVFVLLFGGHGFDFGYLACELCGGGLMLGAWFMATDYVTSPITKLGQIVFGIVLGIMTGIIRIFSNSSEGVSYAIIFCNLLVPIIERYTMPRAFGILPKKKAKKEGGAAK
ncbi:MAG: RnfABCDGE type electron transport complex subunit D [Lachnospiraceae bacterium]|nr:RnfABCDGE type electron transport complex subunit D [Lachnospiraceae bacterium]